MVSPLYYILGKDGKTPVPFEETTTLFELLRSRKKIVCQENVGDFFISTVFLFIDHSYGEGNIPILFETLVFHNNDPMLIGIEGKRYCTWDEAKEGHAEMVKKYKGKV